MSEVDDEFDFCLVRGISGAPDSRASSRHRFFRPPGRVIQIYIYRMGRVKLKIKRLENTNGRQTTYAKRKHGIMKKANELAILCDIDIILLMFSPTGKLSLCSGKRSIEEVIAKFAQLTPQERAKRKLESLEALKKTFKKLDHDVNIEEFLGTSTQTIEDLAGQAKLLQAQLSEIHDRLSYWTNPDKINSVERLTQMEDSLRESLNQIQSHKENLQKHPLIPLECYSQMGVEQPILPYSWIPNNDGHHIILPPEEPPLLSHRDVECSASSSFASYSGYFGTGRSPEIFNCGQENGVRHELSRTAALRPQLGGQFPYLSYNDNYLSNPKFQLTTEMNPPENTIDYHVNRSFEPPTPTYGDNNHGWASTSGPCAENVFDHPLYPQQQN